MARLDKPDVRSRGGPGRCEEIGSVEKVTRAARPVSLAMPLEEAVDVAPKIFHSLYGRDQVDPIGVREKKRRDKSTRKALARNESTGDKQDQASLSIQTKSQVAGRETVCKEYISTR